MVGFFSNARSVCLAGVVGWAGCVAAPAAVAPRRAAYPEAPSPDDPLAVDPCGVKSSPDVFLKDASFESLKPLRENLAFLKEANPVFVCGLERVELLGNEAYRKSAPPQYTRRSVGLYTPETRVIHLKVSAGITLTHETGHHIHNLGYFAPVVREFLAQSWTYDPTRRRRVHRCEGDDCFLSPANAESTTEDWARTFDYVLMRPVETGVSVNFSLRSEKETPLQKKVALIRSIVSFQNTVKGRVTFGEMRTLEDAEVAALEASLTPTALPEELHKDTIRRIHKLGSSSIRSWVWDKRRYPFLVGDKVVFPVFLEDKKRLGFFAYDPAKNGFVALELTLQDLPLEFKKDAASFSDLEVVPNPDGGALLIGRRAGLPALATPIEFKF